MTQDVRKKFIKNRETHMEEAVDGAKHDFRRVLQDEKHFVDREKDFGGSIWNDERLGLLHILTELSEILGAYDGVRAPRNKGTDHTGSSIVFKWHEAKGPKFARVEKDVYVTLHYNDTYGARMDVENLCQPSEITTYALSGFCRQYQIPFYLNGHDSIDIKESFADEHDTHGL
jgi:hypothetical protein